MVIRGSRGLSLNIRYSSKSIPSYYYPGTTTSRTAATGSRIVPSQQPLHPRTKTWFASKHTYRYSYEPLRASSTPYIAILLLTCSCAYLYQSCWPESSPKETEEVITSDQILDEKDLPHEPAFSDMPIEPGHIGNLTADQEARLRSFWAVTLKTFGVEDHNRPNGAVDTPETASEVDVKDSSAKKKEKNKKRMSIFKKRDKDSDSIGTGDADDKYGQVKEFHEILETETPESLRAAFWTMVKSDHPDALLLRFLRARKWDVDRALVMLISTMKWRASEMHVDDDVIKHGEGGALEDSQSSTAAVKKDGEDFLAQLRLGKSFLHGVDREGRPLCVVRARLHKQGEQSEKSLERYTVYVIETARLVLRTPVETACIIFDMSHFTMANMDYAPVKFMIKVFEANYPESLGIILVHKAPWIFQGIWNIIKGWLDPVVAGKVHFTKHVEDLQTYIPRSQIIKELGGDEVWEYHYIEPAPSENDLMKQEAPRLKLEEERRVDVLEFQKKTFDWIHVPSGSSADGVKKERDVLAERLNTNYWALDPYVRARTLYDRQGIIDEGGKINFYPSKDPAVAVNGSAPPAQPAANADDLD